MGYYDGAETIHHWSPAQIAALEAGIARQDVAFDDLAERGGAFAFAGGKRITITPGTHDNPRDGRWCLIEDGVETKPHLSCSPRYAAWSFFAAEAPWEDRFSQAYHFYQVRVPGKPLDNQFYSLAEVREQFKAMSAEALQALQL